MNKKELIKHIEDLPYNEGLIVDTIKISRKGLLELVEQLDEPEKVVVPQFVADYIEFKKSYDFHVYGAMRVIEDHYDKRVPEWFYEKNIETFIRAWLDGYEVEEEKRFRVKVKGICGNHETLNCKKHSGEWFFSDRKENTLYKTNHTRKELEDAGFGWVFSCEGIEIEEVE